MLWNTLVDNFILSLGVLTLEVGSFSPISPERKLVTLENDSRSYPAKYQPEYDTFGLNVTTYFANERILRHFVRCLFYGEICDMIGKWAKRKENLEA